MSAFVGGLQQLPVLQRVDTASQCAGLSVGVAHHQVLRRDVARLLQTCGAHQVGQGVQCVGMKVIHPFGFVGHHQGALAHRVLGGHAGGAVVGVAAARLDAAQGKHADRVQGQIRLGAQELVQAAAQEIFEAKKAFPAVA